MMFVFKSMAEKSTRDRNKQIKKGLELLVTLFYKWTRKVEEGVTLGGHADVTDPVAHINWLEISL